MICRSAANHEHQGCLIWLPWAGTEARPTNRKPMAATEARPTMREALPETSYHEPSAQLRSWKPVKQASLLMQARFSGQKPYFLTRYWPATFWP